MSGGGAFLGGLVGFMVGGPIGGIIGAVFGNAVSEAGTGQNGANGIPVICPGCGANIMVGGKGRWICPNCRTNFVYDGYRAVTDDTGRDAGAEYDYDEDSRTSDSFNTEQAQDVFFLTMFSLLALMAKADGVVSREEIILVDNFIKNDLQLASEKRDMAIKIFNAAKNSGYSFEGLATQFNSLFRNERNILTTMFDLLLRLAYSDGVFHENEERLIIKAKKIFNISDYEYESFKARYENRGEDGAHNRDRSSSTGGRSVNESMEQYYAALGCSPSDGADKIKDAYKKLAREYHPDVIIAKGLPEDFVKFATQRFQQIQAAYEKIKKARNF
ncbi:MAG: hypothetical protein A2008_06575 [Candidatus Wallbacteria bacterium GWC2_49_35]|uniref:J domain-containing protein n=1 Tax=Candidatus Wallbacteria bacterium GWC2_49_35 TaxID=1817813 RepID=A0A1F7WL91_9BACT|nr:MAG: hypothetical protein A2008_06575 [Candidatus Wallbacteria bacterium GWC2_49_35]HBC76908.1 co-chaperone DjlA [Candidatus Wallbacteria bacterium]